MGRRSSPRPASHGRAVAFEASVGGGIPIIQALGVGLAANQVPAPRGDRQRHLQLHPHGDDPRGAALRRTLWPGPGARLRRGRPDARRRRHRHRPQAGDPGPARLRGLVSGSSRSPGRGSTRSSWPTSRYAAELGYAVKLLAQARLIGGGAGTSGRAPAGPSSDTPLAEVRGRTTRSGWSATPWARRCSMAEGAGPLPTASAVVGDLIDVVVGRAAPDQPCPRPVARRRPAPPSRPARTGPQPVLPAVHDRRPPRRAGRDRPGARPPRRQHRQRDPARPGRDDQPGSPSRWSS